MTLAEFLDARREGIREAWVRRIVEEYPAESVKFIASVKDRFRNPVGSTVERGTVAVFDGLLEGADRETLKQAADGLIRLRAIQDFPPSQAVSFVTQLRDELRRVAKDEGMKTELQQLEARLDDLLLDAFDLYMQCREKVFEIRLSEVKARTWKLLERAEEAQVQRGAEQ